MPPKAKFTREEIINASLTIVRQKGVDALTARELGKWLGSSARPIFTAFKNMDEVIYELIISAKKLYREYIEKGLSEEIPFRGVGKQYILFAIKEPKLFMLLFMTEKKETLTMSNILSVIDDNYDKILNSITSCYNIEKEKAIALYKHLWIYSHGIATLCATGMCRFEPDEINNMISEVFISLIKNMSQEVENNA